MNPGDDETTGLPGIRSWARLYAWVIATLVGWIGLLALLTHRFT